MCVHDKHIALSGWEEPPEHAAWRNHILQEQERNLENKEPKEESYLLHLLYMPLVFQTDLMNLSSLVFWKYKSWACIFKSRISKCAQMMTWIIIAVSSQPETKSVKNDFNISHSFSQIKAAKLVIRELITFSLKYWQWQSDFYLLVQPLFLKDSLITHVVYAKQNPAQFSHLLPQKELQITVYSWIEKLPEKCWPKTFSF